MKYEIERVAETDWIIREDNEPIVYTWEEDKAKQITHDMGLVAMMREKFPTVYRDIAGFYEQYVWATKERESAFLTCEECRKPILGTVVHDGEKAYHLVCKVVTETKAGEANGFDNERNEVTGIDTPGE